jgi:Flp pilus assembly protein protease CpaA
VELAMIQYYWFTITIIILIITSYQDYKNRIIPDKYWAILITLSFPSYIYWILEIASSEEKIISIINIILSLIIAFLLFFLGSFGGGDSKALIVLSLTTPVTRDGYEFLFLQFDPFPSIFAILLFLLIYFLAFAFLLLLRNLFEIRSYGSPFRHTEGSLIAKLNTLLSSRRIRTSKLNSIKHSDPAEIFETDKWILYAPVFQGPIEDDVAIKLERELRESVIQDAISTEREYIWFRPQPPGLIVITLSYLSWVFLASPISPF